MQIRDEYRLSFKRLEKTLTYCRSHVSFEPSEGDLRSKTGFLHGSE